MRKTPFVLAALPLLASASAWADGPFAAPPPGDAYGRFAPPPPCCCPPPAVRYAIHDAPVMRVVHVDEEVDDEVVPVDPFDRRWGVALTASALAHGGGDGVGAALRLHATPRLELELGVGQLSYAGSGRDEAHAAADLQLRITRSDFFPYLVGGVGVSSLHATGAPDRHEGYLEGGLGLGMRVSDRFLVSADVRWAAHHGIDEQKNDAVRSLPTTSTNDDGAEGRLSLVVYF